METCLILGAGLMQKPAILAAKSLGFRTVVIDADKNAVCVPLADCFEPIDLKAKDEILVFAQKLNAEGELKAVFTAGTDFSASVSYVCEKLNLNAHSYQAALNASIKNQMRECFDECHVPSPRFFKVSKNELSANASEKLIEKILEKIQLPLVVKPVDNMGARGCRMVRTQAEFLPAVQVAVNSSRSGTAIVEEYMDGPEFSIDALVYDGTFTVTGFAIRHIKYPPYFIEVGHTMPAILDKKMHDELISTFALGAKALGLSCGAAKADIKYTSKGPMIGEIAGRLSGGYMSGWTYPYASGLNLTKEALKIASGMTPDILEQKRLPVDFVNNGSGAGSSVLRAPYQLYEVPCKRFCAERAWMSIPGVVENIENIDDCCNQEKVEYLPRATVSIGSQVDFPRNNVEKCGNILSLSCECEKAMNICEKAVSDVFITLQANNIRTDNYLQRKTEEYEAGFPPDAFAEVPLSVLEEVSGSIPENAKVCDFIPETLKKSEYKDMQDWNYNTIEQTCIKFDKLRPVHPELDAKRFWSALLRGGLQALVYISDSAK